MMMIPKRNSDFDLWSDLFDDPFFSNHETKVMRTDIKEGKDNYDIIIDLPGYDKENIKIDIDNGYLNVTASMNKQDDEKEEGKFVRRERYFGEASRSFYVGDKVTEEDIHATFKNGILKLNIPKKAEEQISQKKYIEISD